MPLAAVNMGEAAKREGVELRMNTEVTTALIDEIAPDEVILAIGSSPMMPPVDGVTSAHVLNSHDVLWGTVHPEGRVVIIGGGLGILRKICVMESLYGHGVQLMSNSKCCAIEEDTVIIEKDGERLNFPADYVVMAVGSQARDKESLASYLDEKDIPYHVIGDAVQARKALNAIWEGAEVARRI
ncbi:hypothetical protein [Paenibacillus sp. CMAA1364]